MRRAVLLVALVACSHAPPEPRADAGLPSFDGVAKLVAAHSSAEIGAVVWTSPDGTFHVRGPDGHEVQLGGMTSPDDAMCLVVSRDRCVPVIDVIHTLRKP